MGTRKFGRLKEKIGEVFGTQKAFADVMGMDRATLNCKLNSKAVWTLDEMEKACLLLEIPNNNIQEYFFY